MKRTMLALVVIFAATCGGSKAPTAPAGPPSATLATRGTLAFTNCALGLCSFEGEGVNNGPGCATNVRGVSRLYNSANAEVGRAEWALASSRRIRPQEAFIYSGCCFTFDAANTPNGTYRTELSWDSTGC